MAAGGTRGSLPREGAQQTAAAEKAAAAKEAKEDERAVALQQRHIFGFSSAVKGSLHFGEECQLLYPAGHNVIMYLTDQKTQYKIFPGTEGSEGISCLALSPCRKFLAVCERYREKAVCSIFDVHTGKRRRGTLTYADCDAKEFSFAAFSQESKHLITQGGAPDWTLILWSWDKARPQGAVKVSNTTGSIIHECSFKPTDSNVACVIGDGIFKFFRLSEGFFKQVPNQSLKLREASSQNYLCHTWLHDDRLVVCSESGDILLFDSGGEFKTVLACSPVEPRALLCIVAFSKGFICGGDNGIVRVYERSDDTKEFFRKQKEFTLNTANAAPLGAVTYLGVSPQEEMLAIATSNSQLLQLGLSQSDLLSKEDSSVEHMLTSFHSGPIQGLDVCVRKPLIVTCGSDKSVRIWNYIDKTLELCKFFNEEAYSVAFHPSGFHLIVGFSDKLRLMNLLMEDVRGYKDIPIKACRECRFSHGGQFFAAASSNTIQIYRTYTCEVVCNLRGHHSKVRSVCWTADDSRILSTGADGAAFEFDMIKDGRRVSDFVQKGINFSSVIVNTDPATQTNTMYLAGSDKMLKEVQSQNATNPTNYLESSVTIGQLALAAATKALFAGLAEAEAPGAVRCYNFPLNGDYVEYQAHAAPVTRLRTTYDDQYLFSTGEDGCLVIFDVKRNEKKNAAKIKTEGLLGFADEILVTRAFLDEKQAALLDLERQVEELTSKIEFQLRHRDSFHKEKMAELQEKYGEEIETERRKFEQLREEKTEMEMDYEDTLKHLEENHSKQTQELETSFQQKMLIEVGRYEKLANDLEREKQEWEQQHSALVQEQSAVIEQMRHDFERHQKANMEGRELILREKENAFKNHQETLAQLEQDADREIEELKEMYEQKLAQEKEEKVRLRGQAGIHRKHHDDLKRQMERKKDDVRKEEEKNRKAEEKIVGLIKDRDSNEKEIKERDKTIGEKEKRISALRNQNQELEKFRFVLDYKIKELKAQIDPKNDDINHMRTQTMAMDAELEGYKRKNKQLALDISQLQMKQRALQEEIKSQKRRLRVDLALIQRFKLDLSETMESLAEPKALKESIVALYWKYVQTGSKKLDLDTDLQKEYNRQRDYLEKSVDSLKRKLEKDSQAHRVDNMRIMQENVSLIREINLLRREINALKHERTAQEMQALAQGGRGSAKEADRELTMQREEIEALTNHLSELESRAPRASLAAPADERTTLLSPSGVGALQSAVDKVPSPQGADPGDSARVSPSLGEPASARWGGPYEAGEGSPSQTGDVSDRGSPAGGSTGGLGDDVLSDDKGGESGVDHIGPPSDVDGGDLSP